MMFLKFCVLLSPRNTGSVLTFQSPAMYKCFFSFCSIDNLLLSKSLKDFPEYEGGLYIQPTIVLNLDLRSFLPIFTNNITKSLLVVAVSFTPETLNFGTFGGFAHPP